MSEKSIMYKGINDDKDNEIQIDYDIVQKMKEKYFNNNEECNINCDIIVENIKNNFHNKITTIYYLLLKEKNENNDDSNYIKNKSINNKNENNSTKNNYYRDNKRDFNSDKITLDLMINKNNENNHININEQENEKSPSFSKITEKTEKIKDSEINNEENEQFSKKIKNYSNTNNNK